MRCGCSLHCLLEKWGLKSSCRLCFGFDCVLSTEDCGGRGLQASLPALLPGDSPVVSVSPYSPLSLTHSLPGPVVRPHPEGGGVDAFLPAERSHCSSPLLSLPLHVPHGPCRCAAFTWVLCMRTPGRRNHFAYCSYHAHEGNAVLLLLG